MEHLFDYGGEQMAYYLGKDLGDLLMVTLNKLVPTYSLKKKLTFNRYLFSAVEATLAIILLKRCE